MASLYLDADVAQAYAIALRGVGHDCLTAFQHRRLSAVDGLQLIECTALGRLLVTHNGKDFRALCQAWPVWRASWGLDPIEQAGVVVLPKPLRTPVVAAVSKFSELSLRENSLWNHLWYLDWASAEWQRQV